MRVVVNLFIFLTLAAVERRGARRAGRSQTWP
jgi:hypothetical protein